MGLVLSQRAQGWGKRAARAPRDRQSPKAHKFQQLHSQAWPLPLGAVGAERGSSPLGVAFYGQDGVVQAPRVLRLQRLVLLREAVRARRPVQGAATARVGRQHVLQEVFLDYPRVFVHFAPLVPFFLLVVEQLGQEVDVLHGQAQDLILAEFFVGRVCGDELAQLREGAVDVLLPPPLPAVGEDATNHLRVRTCNANQAELGLKGTGIALLNGSLLCKLTDWLILVRFNQQGRETRVSSSVEADPMS